MNELYPVSSVVVVLADKLVAAVASAGCKIVGIVLRINMIAMTTTAPVLAIQYRSFLQDFNILLNIIGLLLIVIPTIMDKDRSSLKKITSIFLSGPFEPASSIYAR